MKIKKWLVRGDTHGVFTWLNNDTLSQYKPEETAIIILGDAGFNFYLSKTDSRLKKEVNEKGFTFYCVRGNHEQRPQEIKNMLWAYDDEVEGTVYYEAEYPNIKYFKDYGFYKIGGHSCLVIGGAYSIDKDYRLGRFGFTPETNIPKKTGWFNGEQLNKNEMIDCIGMIGDYAIQYGEVEFILTHTCPKSFQPTDLFLGFVDQSKVDSTMEEFLDIVNLHIGWKYWLFGHYHADRLEKPHVEQYYNDIEDIETIINRWKKYDETGELDWWLVKSPNFYEEI